MTACAITAISPILDWRLGLDMARLALDAAAPMDLSPLYWTGVPDLAIQRLHYALAGSNVANLAGLPAVVLGRRDPSGLAPRGSKRAISAMRVIG